jgi:pilus assembly protein CpaC
LLDDRTTAQFSKIPGIGDLPILGQLFKSRNTSRTNTELLVLVTPSIVDPVAVQAPAPPTPQPPVKDLDRKGFDKTLPADQKNPQASQ